MAKTNYTKVEEALIEGLRKMQVEELLELADIAAGAGSREDTTKEKRKMGALALGHALNCLRKREPNTYKQLKVKKKDIDAYLKPNEEISDESWAEIKELKTRIVALKKELYADKSDEDIVEIERERHIKKRFNVNEKWLPLD